MHCPMIVNQTDQTIVVFLERGILYNKQVLLPGEAVSMTRSQTGGLLVPYYIHAAIGNDQSWSDDQARHFRNRSAQNLLSVAAIPTAFLMGALCTAMSAGTLAGPSAALVPLASGLVVKGVVFDAAALAAGGIWASRVALVSEYILKKHPDKFLVKSDRCFPGRHYVAITGGLEDSLQIKTLTRRQFNQLKIKTFKEPTDGLHDIIRHHIPNLPGGRHKKLKQQQDGNNNPAAIMPAAPGPTMAAIKSN